jgi:hypothetical protein
VQRGCDLLILNQKEKSNDRSLRQLLQEAIPVQLEKVAQCNGKNADC